MDVAPGTLSFAHLDRLPGFGSHAGHFGNLHATLLDRTSSLAVDDRRKDQSSLGSGDFVEEIVVYDPLGRVLFDDIPDLDGIVDVAVDSVGAFSKATFYNVGD